MFTNTQKCRACGSTELIPVFNLGLQPLANSFRKTGEEHDGYAPLSVLYCPRCTLGQLSVVVKPEILYRDYKYVTSPSETMRRHFMSIFEDIRAECPRLDCVVEIGSNDGLLLQFFQKMTGCSALGIEPASNLATIASGKGIPTLNTFFSKENVASLAGCKREIDLILARHVFCHVDDWKDFVAALESLCFKDTLVCIEAPYAVDTLARVEFDQVYHEHLSFLTIKSVKSLLRDTKLRLHKIVRYPIHGGSIMVMLRHVDSSIPMDQSVIEFLSKENVTLDSWNAFSETANRNILSLRELIKDLADQGKSIAGFGASAKSTVWINAAGLSPWLKFVTDTTEQKIGRYVPGTGIPVVHQSHLLSEQPDYAVVFAWNFLSEILSSQQEYRNRGGKFIIPVPIIEII